MQRVKKFESLEIDSAGGSREAASKQMQIQRRSLLLRQPSALYYLLSVQKSSSDGSLSLFPIYGVSKLRNHLLQAAAVGSHPSSGSRLEYSNLKTSLKELDETRRHPGKPFGHPEPLLPPSNPMSPSPPLLAAQSFPSGVPIPHDQCSDGYTSPLGSPGATTPPLPSLLAVLRSDVHHPVGARNISTDTYSQPRVFLPSSSSHSLPPNSLSGDPDIQEATHDHTTGTRSARWSMFALTPQSIHRAPQRSELPLQCCVTAFRLAPTFLAYSDSPLPLHHRVCSCASSQFSPILAVCFCTLGCSEHSFGVVGQITWRLS
ncbi:hypothetical protein B0H13DRAFT_2394226 [Mycena leptocephala]|nr:hypothetical protein B0H13DRAFT_2394226 [Mycena leptocephala]